uniref:Uncharacterized protein n=1 Tax=viral metagenome TaxID=1070528 RepID=A0A6C0LZ33_9ZZZZ
MNIEQIMFNIMAHPNHFIRQMQSKDMLLMELIEALTNKQQAQNILTNPEQNCDDLRKKINELITQQELCKKLELDNERLTDQIKKHKCDENKEEISKLENIILIQKDIILQINKELSIFKHKIVPLQLSDNIKNIKDIEVDVQSIEKFLQQHL